MLGCVCLSCVCLSRLRCFDCPPPPLDVATNTADGAMATAASATDGRTDSHSNYNANPRTDESADPRSDRGAAFPANSRADFRSDRGAASPADGFADSHSDSSANPCPDGSAVTKLCPPNSRGTFNVTCPGFVQQPSCVSASLSSIDCTMVGYTASNTICSCVVDAEMDGSGLISLLPSAGLQIESRLIYVRDDYFSMYIEDPAFTDVQHGNILNASLEALVFFTVVAFLGSSGWEFYAEKRLVSKKKKKKSKKI